MDQQAADAYAKSWIAAWNAHDLERILSHFSDDARLVSPRVRELLGDPTGTIVGKSGLRDYFGKGLAAAPSLRFELVQCFYGVDNIALQYRRHDGRTVVELLEFDPAGKANRAVVCYTKV